MSSDGTLRFTVLPIYAGAVNHLGQEPMSDSRYRRGMIQWDMMPNGEQIGRANVDVPEGMWHWVIYCYHPTLPVFWAVNKLPIPVVLSQSGVLALDCITMENIQPNAHPLGVLPD